jgi:hypothetical protein
MSDKNDAQDAYVELTDVSHLNPSIQNDETHVEENS